MADQEEDYSSLPLQDRWQHKVWKVRKGAYEDAAKQFEATPDEHDPAFRLFLSDSGLMKSAVADSNVAAQQDGIAALCAFLKFGSRDNCLRTRNQTITPLVEKGLSSTRAATKAAALEALLLYIELDVAGPVIEDLLPALGHKQPKIIAATLTALTSIFHNYGCKTADPKPVLKQLPNVFGHADKNVRAESTNLAVELYRWLRDAMKPMFWGELKPTQQTDLEAQFEKIRSEPSPKQDRLLRSQQAAKERAPVGAAEVEEENELEAEPEEIDAFDLAEPQDVLHKVPSNYHENLASSKWKDRKDAVDALYTLLNIPRIKDGDYSEIIRGLAKCMKDANIAVVITAAQCIEVIAKGLRRPFAKYRPVVTGPILERLKEKKASVTDALGAALDQVFIATSLSELLEEVLEFLKHKNPQVKEGTMKFLIRCLRITREAPTKPEVALIAESAKKLLAESSEGLRSGGAEVLGTVMKIMGERQMGPYLEGLDDIRKAKIKEYFETAEVKAKDRPKPAPAPAARGPPAGAPKKVIGKRPAGAAPPKKTAPAPAAPTAPLAPQPTSRSIPGSKLGKPSGLAAPSSMKAPLKKTLAGPGGAAPPSLASPSRRPASAVAQPEEDAPLARIGLGRGLAGRSLAKAPTPALNAPAAPPTSPPLSLGATADERAELEELRTEKERLSRQNDEMRQERSRLNSEVQELKNQNAQLIEDHTRDVLSIKAKETQLIRARSDTEAAEDKCSQLRREMERLKRALTSAERVNSPPIGLPSPTRDGAMSDGIYRDTGMHPPDREAPYPNRAPMSFNSSLSEEKENTGDVLSNPYTRKPQLSPGLERNGRTSAASGSAGQGSPGPHANGGMKRNGSVDSGRGEMNSHGQGQGVESWKRAAEVTSALKAKIELMKARQGINKP